MPHVVTQACCGDASCVYACPVNCIHPTPDEPDFLTAEMLYIDADSCVDCGACVSACPVGAIVPDAKIAPDQLPFVDINALFYLEPKTYPIQAPVPSTVKMVEGQGPLRVAIVGSGPAALYAADELLRQPGIEVNVFEKLPTPHGLVRAGVAPDHQKTKSIDGLFRHIEDQPGFGYFLNVKVGLNVEVGVDITHSELLDHHHAVMYATGASEDRRLAIPGENLAGSCAATEFVAWYNGHPDFADRSFDFSHKRAVIVGNGNVALDVARILTMNPSELAKTDIADHALEALRNSRIEEVVLLGRRGVAQAAYTLPELVGLLGHQDVDFIVEGAGSVTDSDPIVGQKIAALHAASSRARSGDVRKRIVFRYLVSPTELIGTDKVEGVRLVHNELVADPDGVLRPQATSVTETIQAGLVLRSIGYRGAPVAGLPFDVEGGVVPNDGGRVLTETGGDVVPGSYVAGWIKRGPSGFIGTNKTCSLETASNVITDFNLGLLSTPHGSSAVLTALVAERQADSIDLRGWRTIDLVERTRGIAQGRVRQKFTHAADMVLASRSKVPNRRRFTRTSR